MLLNKTCRVKVFRDVIGSAKLYFLCKKIDMSTFHLFRTIMNKNKRILHSKSCGNELF